MVVPEDVRNAAYAGRFDAVRAWFDSGDAGDPNDLDQHGESLLFHAFEGSSRGTGVFVSAPEFPALVSFLVARGADVNLQSQRAPHAGVSCLHRAMLAWNVSTVDLLLKHGADVTLKDDRGLTPLEHGFSDCLEDEDVFCHFNVAILRKLLRAGASLDFLVAGITNGEHPFGVSPDGYLRALIEVGVPGLSLGDAYGGLNVERRVREINEGIDLIAGVRRDGSYRAYLRRPHMVLLRIRSLRAHRRAHATAATTLYVACVLDPALPREIAWGILSFWRDAG